MLGFDRAAKGKELSFGDNPPTMAVIAAQYDEDLTKAMRKAAETTLRDLLCPIEILEVSGVLELGPALKMAANSGRFEGYVVIGATVEGEHGEDVYHQEAVRAVSGVASGGHPVGTAILYADTRKKLLKLANQKKDNPGKNAAFAALELVDLARRLSQSPKGIGFKPASDYIIMADNGSDTTTT